MKRLITSFLFAFLCLQLSVQVPTSTSAARPPDPEGSKVDVDLSETIIEAVRHDSYERTGIILYDAKVDNIEYSQDRKLAVAWLELINPSTGEALPSEPGLVIARYVLDKWEVILPTHPDWAGELSKLPDTLLPDEVRSSLIWVNNPQRKEQLNSPLGGYLLPWEVGKTVYLSRSIAHDRDIPSGNAHFSFDFYVPSSMFDIHAAKSGSVWLFKDDVPNNDHSDVNYLVLQDTSTVPTTYQLYLHLAQNSIPPSLKTVGAPVEQGQFIGTADNTGQSTGHHLHFQVETLPYWSYWGISLDIAFNDVDINGGRPRVPVDLPYCLPDDICEQTRSAYISGNYFQNDPDAPYGDITYPENGFLLENSTIQLSGWATDVGGGNTYTKFKAYYGGSWHFISPEFNTSSFSYTWDLCSSSVEDGPVSVALDIFDAGGNWAGGLTGLHHMIKNYACPSQPVCLPDSNQVALYSEADFQGSCTILGIGSHNSSALGLVGAANSESIRIGSNVYATVYKNNTYSGRGETIFNDDVNLSENRIGGNTISSVKVFTRTTLPVTPFPLLPSEGASYPADASFSFVGEDTGGASEFSLKLDGNILDWNSSPVWHQGSLSSGTHSWRIKSRNVNGESDWSQIINFSTTPFTDDPTTENVLAPFHDNMESGYNGWSNSNNWDQSLIGNHTPGGQVTWAYEVNNASQGYDNGQSNSGYLTSPPITIPTSGYFLNYWYLYETENSGIYWDQRWIQISIDGSPFTNLYQLSDDPPNYWLQSPRTDLSGYAGSTIRIRFYFATLDNFNNSYKGWLIDDFSVSMDPPPQCPSSDPDETPDQARLVQLNSTTYSEICPAGDIDFYKFQGNVGDQVGIATRAKSESSLLDTFIYLLGTDGRSNLAWNDDQIPGSLTDSFLSYRLGETGTYYIKVLAWNHPSVGSESHFYYLDLHQDTEDPVAQFTNPPSNTFLPNSALSLEVTGIDASSGINHVEFFWHPGDWLFANWNYLGSDWDGSDGWTYLFNTNSMPDQRDIAFYAKVVDWAGNSVGTGAWNLWLDRTPPFTALQPITDQGFSNLVKIDWIGYDNLSGIDHLDIQIKEGANPWVDWLVGLEAGVSHAWFTGSFGTSYGFRMRGADRIGNTELYPSEPEVTFEIPEDVCFTGDQWENDNDWTSATNITTSGEIQSHDFCNTLSGSGWIGDQDWFVFTVGQNERLTIQANPETMGTAPVLELFSDNGTIQLAQSAPSIYGDPVRLYWLPDESGTLYLKVTHINNLAAGQDLRYQISVFQGEEIFLPFTQKAPNSQ